MIPQLATTILLAFIQSATEFLPVSSSAHLVLSQSLGFTDQGIFTDITLHAGTLIAIVFYFWDDIVRMYDGIFEKGTYNRRLLRNVIVATIPVIVGGVMGLEIISRLRAPIIIAGTSIIFGALLWVSDRMTLVETDLREMTAWDALCIGLAQLLALVPGVSRSGIVITCCRALGYTRRDSTKFAMLLAVPTISAAAAYVIFQTAMYNIWNRVFTWEMFLGTALSAIFGWAVIRFLMGWVRRASFAVFSIYRIALGLFIIWYFFF
jgi:undecaprenyl-diphosphatase